MPLPVLAHCLRAAFPHRFRSLFPHAGALLACALLGPPAQAQAPDTLQRIAQTGVVNIAYRESSVPFSYYDSHHRVVGYSYELALKAVEELRRELKLPSLTIRQVPVTSQNRIPMLQNGSVDIECGSTTHNRERAKQAAFSVSIFVISTRLMVHKNSDIRDFADLAGKRVVVTAGTTSERLLRTYAEAQGVRMQIQAVRDHGVSFELLERGEADAFMMDDALLYGERAKARRPDDWILVGQPMSSEVYACMMRREDHALREIVDRALVRYMKSGEIMALYERWFQRPIPPSNLNLDWPPTPALREFYRSPQSKSLD